jgi:hypothetical protein
MWHYRRPWHHRNNKKSMHSKTSFMCTIEMVLFWLAFWRPITLGKDTQEACSIGLKKTAEIFKSFCGIGSTAISRPPTLCNIPCGASWSFYSPTQGTARHCHLAEKLSEVQRALVVGFYIQSKLSGRADMDGFPNGPYGLSLCLTKGGSLEGLPLVYIVISYNGHLLTTLYALFWLGGHL